jgi:hypothetical protein
MESFQKAQRTYYAFAKLANIYKCKKAKVKINIDLYMNEITENKKNVISIIQDKSKYLFTSSDILKIINTSLINAPFFFAQPLQPKNPYNNIAFDHSTLYNIYFFLRYNCYMQSTLFDLYFKANFNLDSFLYDNESFIRDASIKNYVNNSPAFLLHHNLGNMFEMNRYYTKKLFIHEDIPKETIVAIFRPYFYLFFSYKYGVVGTEKRINSLHLLKKKLKEFVLFNPMFGRKKCKMGKRFNIRNSDKPVVMETTFNLTHIDFYKNYPEYNVVFEERHRPRGRRVLVRQDEDTEEEEEDGRDQRRQRR